MNVISLFCGCGGLDKGFENAGFNVIWANDNDENIGETYKYNHPNTDLIIKNISKIKSEDIPNNIVGLIGGPPCQSWSAAGNGHGIDDPRGALFYEYIRVLKDKKPLFFLAENVKGILSKKHEESLSTIIDLLDNAGYEISIELVNSADYEVPQKRERVIIIGYKKNSRLPKFELPSIKSPRVTVRETIGDLSNIPPLKKKSNYTLGEKCHFPNHEYFLGSYSYIFMSRNRVLDWDSQSYTIQASGRQASLHPQAPKMRLVEKDVREFVKGKLRLYRRLSIRECARIQTFPDTFIFKYDHMNKGYKMIGNAVPVKLAQNLAIKIKKDIQATIEDKSTNIDDKKPQRALVNK